MQTAHHIHYYHARQNDAILDRETDDYRISFSLSIVTLFLRDKHQDPTQRAPRHCDSPNEQQQQTFPGLSN